MSITVYRGNQVKALCRVEPDTAERTRRVASAEAPR
jgi:hypothetical protein